MNEHRLHAVMPGLVVRLLVGDGDEVAADQPLLVTETMKCEQTLRAPSAGRVQMNCRAGEVVSEGAILASVQAIPQGPPKPPRRSRTRPPEPREVIAKVCGVGADPALRPWAASGTFVEYDLLDCAQRDQVDQVDQVEDSGAQPTANSRPVRPSAYPGDRLVPKTAPPRGTDTGRVDEQPHCGVTVGVMTHRLDGHPHGLSRVWIGGDPSRSMGAVSERECRRIIAAFDLAEANQMPVEWVALSAGAKIAWDSGTENMDWCAAVVARIVHFTQAGGQVVVIVNGINVGAQSYWNAEATMLGHHQGMLVMVRDQAMVLTGKTALALSGGGSFATDANIGGYAEVMGPNGEAHHQANDIVDAYRLVFTHHSLCSRQRNDAQACVASPDPVTRNICTDRYDESEPFAHLGDILNTASHPDRKQAFAIRPVMGALADRDAPVLERWADTVDAEGVVAWDTRIGGRPISLMGVESRPYRTGSGRWLAGGVLHPEGSRKLARALSAASGNRPAVVLANLAGFDGSATSMRGRQLEFGAEIARAVTNFKGPLVVIVLGRFHGGAYVVFSKALSPQVKIVALEGTYVSVIGGDAAAGVVFARELKERIRARMRAESETGTAGGAGGGLDEEEVHRTERDRLAREFDQIHDVRRAQQMGSIDQIIAPRQLRETVASLIEAECSTPLCDEQQPPLQQPADNPSLGSWSVRSPVGATARL